MATVTQYLQYSETAMAAYAIALSPIGANKTAFFNAGMTSAQAQRFDDSWTALSQAPDGVDGFSAVLLQNRTTGEKVLAIRGTEGVADYITDLVNVAAIGSVVGMPQYAALEIFYQQLIAEGK